MLRGIGPSFQQPSHHFANLIEHEALQQIPTVLLPSGYRLGELPGLLYCDLPGEGALHRINHRFHHHRTGTGKGSSIDVP